MPRRSRHPHEKENARGSISRVLSTLLRLGFEGMGDHSSRGGIAPALKQPTRATGPEQALEREAPRRPYSVLLPVGFTMPPPLPAPRCALTAPFHFHAAEA